MTLPGGDSFVSMPDETVREIIQYLEATAHQIVPDDPHSASPVELRETLVKLLENERAKQMYPVPQDRSDRYSLAQVMQNLVERVQRLEQAAADPPVTPPQIDPVDRERVLYAKVTAVYKSGGSTPLTPWTDYETDGQCAQWCTANPCEVTGANTKTDVIVRIGFPAYALPSGAGETPYPFGGVTVCPVGTIIKYVPLVDTLTLGTVTLDGIEAGWLRGLVWAFRLSISGETPNTWVGRTGDTDVGERRFMTGLLAAAAADALTVYSRLIVRDATGRCITESARQTTTISAYVDVPVHGACPVLWNEVTAVTFEHS